MSTEPNTTMRMAYIDHSFHQKTQSTQFFLAFLRRSFAVDDYWDEAWSGGRTVDPYILNQRQYRLIVFFQVLYPPEILRQLDCQNLVFVPMYDAGGNQKGAFWLPYRKYWFISFSQTAHRNLRSLGIASFSIRYFPDPSMFPCPPLGAGDSVFFWTRSDQVSWTMVKRLLARWCCRRFWLHLAPDPEVKAEGPDDADRQSFDIVESHWFPTRSELHAAILEQDIYIAPRAREGIGMSFLEAMAMGRCVVAADEPTMNEYITSHKTGVLFSMDDVAALKKPKSVAKLGAAARTMVEVGYPQYQGRLLALAKEIEYRFHAWPRPKTTPNFVATVFMHGLRKKLGEIKRSLLRTQVKRR